MKGFNCIWFNDILYQRTDAQLVDNVCDLKKDVGPCNANMRRYYYDVDSGECKLFFYGGCDGNENNFKTMRECYTGCKKRVCTLPKDNGSGEAKIKRWFYNADTMKCETFIYGGLYGNKNNFKTKRGCEKLCNGVKKDPCGPIPPCVPPPPNYTCGGFTYDVINGVKCITGCFHSRCKQGSCPSNPLLVCTRNCLIDEECAENKLCCSGCCRVPILDPKPGKCPNDPGQSIRDSSATQEGLNVKEIVSVRANGSVAAQTQATPSFYALDNPCFDKDKLCSSSCEVVTLKHDVVCEFCYCKNPDNKISWPTTVPTVPTTIQTTLTTSGTRSPYITVNNITYVTLRNPCELKFAMCPTFCEKSNVSYHGRICENCYCPKVPPKDVFGKRDNTLGNVVLPGRKLKRENAEDISKESYNSKTKRCVPFFCPLYRCPAGKVFEIGPDGCQICRCIIKQQAGSKPDPTELFCLPSPEYCHSDCLVHNITVDDWHCFFCRCPQGEVFMAMLNPCNHKVRVCPSYCTIRHLEDIILGTIRCDYCDCKTTKKQDLERESRFLLQVDSKVTNIAIASTLHCLELPGDCPSYCHAFTVHNNAWKCHVCLCHGVLIPRTFIHHLHSSSLTSGVASPSISTSPYYTKPHSSKTVESLTTSEVPVTTVYRSSPLPTSDVPVNTVNRSSPLPSTEVPVKTLNRSPPLPTTEVPVTSVYRPSPLASSEVPVTTVNRSSQLPSNEVPVTTVKRPSPLPTSGSTFYPNNTNINNPTTYGGSISCFICNSSNCNDSELQLCSSDKKYCMNTFTANTNGTKDISRSQTQCWRFNITGAAVSLKLHNKAIRQNPKTQKVSQESVIHRIVDAELIEYNDSSESGTDIVPIFELANIAKLYSKRLEQLGVVMEGMINTTLLKNWILAAIEYMQAHICVSEDECNKKWWLKTADDPMCLTLQNGESVELPDTKECNFCCTENGCNKNLKIDDHLFIGKE
ncbi:unnamed protein product [Mytilus coruscus]|uniref:BPTI/Kunitz inhibitor domain-containing protein n=1 Tax=Mytilus coruscus TaxID=42192 RepID=A0A6J8C0X3_MYTCO|nr:unnamed protein product [Mytilus coruscus]